MGLLDGKVSQDDLERRHDMVHHSQYESGFDGSGGDDMFGDDTFDMNELFGDDSFGGGSSDPFGGGGSFSGGNSNPFGGGGSSNPFGGNNDPFGSGGSSFGGNDPFGGSSFGNNGGFGGNSFGGNGFGGNGFGGNSFGGNGFGGNGFGGNGFGNPGQNQGQQQQPPKEDVIDKLMNTSTDAAKNLGSILVDMFKSIKERNADDFGFLSMNMIKTGGILIPIGVVTGIIGVITSVKFLSFSGMGIQLSLCGGLCVASGIIGMGTSALILTKQGDIDAGTIDDIADVPNGNDNFTQQYEDNIGDELDDLFGDDFDDLFNDTSTDAIASEPEPEEEAISMEIEEIPEEINWDEALNDVNENRLINRELLFETFKPMFPTCTPKFSDINKIEPDSKDFATLETICLKALANIANCELEEVKSNLVSAEESFFSYTLLLKRFNKVKNCDALASEIEIYLRDDADDDSINATVNLVGDNYKIIVTKGVTAIVAFGDVFKKQEVCDFFLNTKNKLPVITGIDELGRVITEDAKLFDTMMICGKPRSGKSWYVLSILMCLILFNTPEDVQFIIVDPKKSTLFKTMSLLPHVCGLHDDSHILQVLDDVINTEAPRRKKLLEDHKADDIWALREKGINLPILYIVIDEYITVKNNLDKDQQKEFNVKFQTIISQLPSLGIRLMFVPHRSTGIVDKTNRTMLQFTAAVRADVEDVNDALGVKDWKRSLTRPGDIAMKSSSMKNASYVRGAALTTTDEKNTKFMETAAKAFYKMGIDMPDMSAMRIACNRDERKIQEELGGETTRIQYNASTLLDDIENMDFSSI